MSNSPRDGADRKHRPVMRVFEIRFFPDEKRFTDDMEWSLLCNEMRRMCEHFSHILNIIKKQLNCNKTNPSLSIDMLCIVWYSYRPSNSRDLVT